MHAPIIVNHINRIPFSLGWGRRYYLFSSLRVEFFTLKSAKQHIFRKIVCDNLQYLQCYSPNRRNCQTLPCHYTLIYLTHSHSHTHTHTHTHTRAHTIPHHYYIPEWSTCVRRFCSTRQVYTKLELIFSIIFPQPGHIYSDIHICIVYL